MNPILTDFKRYGLKNQRFFKLCLKPMALPARFALLLSGSISVLLFFVVTPFFVTINDSSASFKASIFGTSWIFYFFLTLLTQIDIA